MLRRISACPVTSGLTVLGCALWWIVDSAGCCLDACLVSSTGVAVLVYISRERTFKEQIETDHITSRFTGLAVLVDSSAVQIGGSPRPARILLRLA